MVLLPIAGPSDPLTVDVSDKDLTGLGIKAMRGANLAGVVVVENSDDTSSDLWLETLLTG